MPLSLKLKDQLVSQALNLRAQLHESKAHGPDSPDNE